jgi:hypothetical protein
MKKNSVRVMALMAAMILAFVMVQFSAAGETVKFRSKHINVATRFDTIEVGDVKGHVEAIFTAKGVGYRYEGPAEDPYKIEIWGIGDYKGDGTGKEIGYGKFIFADGSYYYEQWNGNVSGSSDTGTATYYGGSGRFEGMKGGSKFDCVLLGDRFICDVEGTIELP